MSAPSDIVLVDRSTNKTDRSFSGQRMRLLLAERYGNATAKMEGSWLALTGAGKASRHGIFFAGSPFRLSRRNF